MASVGPLESPLALAALRIAVPLVILASPELYAARGLAREPAFLAFPAEGLGWLAALPLEPAVFDVAVYAAITSAATAVLGFWSRTSMAVLTISAGLAFSLSQMRGAVLHDMHLLWLTALLAVSRCGDAWSLDTWGLPRPAPALAYGVPATIARLLLGVVYLFPGLHKLADSGLGWISDENIRGHLYGKWFQHQALPSFRLDHWPTLALLGAAFVIAFELSFIVLVSFRRTRWLAALGGVLFHAATQICFFISFTSLLACYVVLLPWDGIVARLKPNARTVSASPQVPWAALGVGSVLLLVNGVQGLRGQTQGWPFACYPTFAHVQPLRAVDLSLELVTADGQVRTFDHRSRPRSQAEWGRVYALLGANGRPSNPLLLRRFADESLPPTAGLHRLWRAEFDTTPEAWGRAPLRRKLLMEWDNAP